MRFKLNRLEEQRETYWRQHAHVHWLKCVDINTKFFHATASKRKRRNKIRRLKKEISGEMAAWVRDNIYGEIFSGGKRKISAPRAKIISSKRNAGKLNCNHLGK